MADSSSGGLDIASIISKLAPIFLGSGTTTGKTTDTNQTDTGPQAAAENAAVFSTALNNANNPDITDAVTQNILHNAALAFSPVLGEERSSGLYNTSVKQQLAGEAQARATAEASKAALDFRTSQEQIASAAAGQLTAATKRSVSNQGTQQRTSPVIPGKSSATALGAGSLLLGAPGAISKVRDLIKGGNAAKTANDISGFGPENNPELGGGRISPDQITDFASNPDNATIFNGNAIGSEGQFGDIAVGGQADTASLAPVDIATIADPVDVGATVSTASNVVGAGEIGGGAVTAAEGTADAAAAADATSSFIDPSQAFIDIPQEETITGANDIQESVVNPRFFNVQDFQGSDLSNSAIFNEQGQFLGSGSQELADPTINGTLAQNATFTDTFGETFSDVGGSLVDTSLASADTAAGVGVDVAGIGADAAGAAAAGDLAGAGAADIAGATAGELSFAAGDAAAGAAGAVGADAAAGALAADAAGAEGFSALDALAVLLSVSCTELMKQGKIKRAYYHASMKAFAGYSNAARRAYWLWGIPAAKYIRSNPDKFLSRLLGWLLINRTEFLAAKAGVKGAKKTLKGKLAQVIVASFTTALGVATLQFLEPKHG